MLRRRPLFIRPSLAAFTLERSSMSRPSHFVATRFVFAAATASGRAATRDLAA